MEMEFESEIIGQDIVDKLILSLESGFSSKQLKAQNSAHRRNLWIWAEREYGGKTHEQIGNDFDLTRERIRQIHRKYSIKVAKFLEEAA